MPRKTAASRKPSRKPRSRTRNTHLCGPLPPNAAELWAATLPTPSELAIAAERTRRTLSPATPVALPVVLDGCAERSPRQWPWTLASIALVAAPVVYALHVVRVL